LSDTTTFEKKLQSFYTATKKLFRGLLIL